MDNKAEQLNEPGKEELAELVKGLLWQLRLTDAFWFVYTEDEEGLEQAENRNARVWGKVSALAARDIKKRFNIQEKGLKGFVQAMKYFCWTMMVEYQLEYQGKELVLKVPVCPAQEGRKKHGLNEYRCKEMHHKEFQNFAREIDEDIKVCCDFAPPDPHPDNQYCQWRFYLQPRRD
ncbi:MAG: DUF6125 family protein [Desulfonatronovibrionaceae bacterium]